MDYRREIDGLRALAVVPVILFHAGFDAFSGGFVGVDVFFVISGYLITTIILTELQQGRFSIVNFYERRARRILPALFVVMAACLILGYLWLMPDEFKNLGQSLVATSLFSNNILLGFTSDYWDLASEFKPLLHTWSLGVEEQYYIVVPLLLIIAARAGKFGVSFLLWAIFLSSFLFSVWFSNVSPKWAFYILPTRAWELGVGALAALYLRKNSSNAISFKLSNALSFTGLLLILGSVFAFDKNIPNPGWPLLAPTVGAALIISFCTPGSFSFKILGSRVFVFIGLLSYSLYLWHQPAFAFLRIYSSTHPSFFDFLALLPLIFILSVLTWRYVETPFRNKSAFGRTFVFLFSACFTALFISAGLYLNKSYGMPLRAFDKDVSIEDMDKRIYNEKVFSLKKSNFSDKNLPKILISGNSFARDFTNITLETFDVSGVEILYRDDLQQCIDKSHPNEKSKIYYEADVIVFASGSYDAACYSSNIEFAESRGKKIFYIGPKHFGPNLNWLIRLSGNDRANQYNTIPVDVVEKDNEMAGIIPSKNFISLLTSTVVNNRIPVTDDRGRMLSTDRAHLTKYGALFFGQKAVVGSEYADLFK